MILELRMTPPAAVDLTGILPEHLGNLSEAEIARKPVRLGNQTVPLGDLFTIREAGFAAERMTLQGDLSKCHSIGAGMSGGELEVDGPVGDHAGARMTGGLLFCESAGDWLGAEMRWGLIKVRGDAGQSVGGAYSGGRRGMSGGRIIIDGDAGEELGARIRGGIIEVKGATGRFAGTEMIAGTIVVEGALGESAGAGMKRGTIIALSPESSLSTGFVAACEFQPLFWPILREKLHACFADFEDCSFRCYRGDLLTGGRGEIWQVLS